VATGELPNGLLINFVFRILIKLVHTYRRPCFGGWWNCVVTPGGRVAQWAAKGIV